MKIPSLSLLSTAFLVCCLVSCGDSSSNDGTPADSPATTEGSSSNGGATSTASNELSETGSAGAGSTVDGNATDRGNQTAKPNAKADLPKIEKSKAPVRGKVRGAELEPTRIAFHRWTLDFEVGTDMSYPDYGIRLLFRKPLDRYAIPFGESFTVKPGDKRPQGLEVQVRRRHPETRAHETETYTDNFYLELVFQPDTRAGGLFGRVHLVTPDAGSYVSGTFEAELKGERIDGEHVELTANSKQTLSYLLVQALAEKTGKKVELVRAYEARIQKTSLQLYIGYIEADVLIDGQPETRSAALARTLEGWSLDRLLDKNQIPDAFPPVEPEMPPQGEARSWINFIVARRVQSMIDSEYPGQGVSRYANALSFGSNCGMSKVKLRIENEPRGVYYSFHIVWDEVGVRIDRQLAPDEVVDTRTCEISTKSK